jgi:transcriptional repressor NrdR
MKCPFCMFIDTQVKDSRPSEDGFMIKRRRWCLNCGARFTTFERVELRELNVIKRNGMKKPFDSNKLAHSIELATRKRSITRERIEEVVSKIIKKLEKYGEGEVESKVIGQITMDELARLDEVAYVRYASVYMDFSKSADFGKFITDMKISKNDET